MDESPQATVPAAPSAESDNKHEIFFRRIADYMQSNEPFRNPNFTVSHLAIATDINHNYITDAIRKEKMNFTTFVNSYRVEFVKKALQQADAKYTIEYLSQTAGFNNQTTFNRVFKASTGVTPTEYMNSCQKEHSDD
jgi:AraC-like DNA-binding protein